MGSPLFKSVKIELKNGKQISIKANNNSKENRYIDQMELNGKVFTKNYLTHEDLMKGTEINFEMSPDPKKTRGISKKDFPYSLSNKK
jgi:putative alpha-1,2-mannosidase